ncbi:hypothetical protein ACFLT5_03355 [Chloroflexota bacterium]
MRTTGETNIKYATVLTLLLLVLFGLSQVVSGGDIDPVDKWAWSTNSGWINFMPECAGCDGVQAYADHLEGYSWGENIGWIRLGTHTGGGAHTYGNTSATNYGVNRNPAGSLYGYAWGTNIGWIKLDPEHGGVSIDPDTGSFDGYAWGENIGWIHFKNADPAYSVALAIHRVYLPLVLRSGS